MDAGPLAVELRGIWHSFEDNEVLRDVSFTVPAGLITVLLGPSGVGKTTCLRILSGLQIPDDGEVLIDGRSLYGLRPRELRALQKRLGVLLAGHGVYGSALWAHMTVLDNVTFQLRELTSLSEDEARERARARLIEVGLEAALDVMPPELSSGMRRRAALARALASDPDLLVLDAPELGIDTVRRRLIRDILLDHHASVGGTYLIVTQDIGLAREVADHAIVLLEGRVAIEGSAGEVLETEDLDVRQLLTGSATGPLQLASEAGAGIRRQRRAAGLGRPRVRSHLGRGARAAGRADGQHGCARVLERAGVGARRGRLAGRRGGHGRPLVAPRERLTDAATSLDTATCLRGGMAGGGGSAKVPAMRRGPLVTGLAVGAAIFAVPSSAGATPRTVTVTLLGGAQITVTVDVPPGTPLDQIRIPGLQGPIVGISDSGPVASPAPPAPAPAAPSAGRIAGCGAWFA